MTIGPTSIFRPLSALLSRNLIVTNAAQIAFKNVDNSTVKVRKLDLLNLHRLLNGAAVKVRQMMAEAELREYSDTCLTQGLRDDIKPTK